MTGVGECYAEGRRRLSALLEAVGDDEAARAVPTCPGWSVHDVVAHLSGACVDILAGNLDGVATPPWTAAQVDARRNRSLAELLAEWSEAAPQVESFADGFPEPSGPMWVADLTAHEHDIRGALGAPGGRDAAGIDMALDFLVTVGLHSALRAASRPPLEVRAGARSWTVGGESPDAAPAARLDTEPFELFRALTGRRSAAQLRALGWSNGPDQYLGAFGFGPFTPSPDDIVE